MHPLNLLLIEKDNEKNSSLPFVADQTGIFG